MVLMPTVSALQRISHEICELTATLGYTARPQQQQPRLKQKEKCSLLWTLGQLPPFRWGLIPNNGVLAANVYPQGFPDCHPTPKQPSQQKPFLKVFPSASYKDSRWKAGPTPSIHTPTPSQARTKGLWITLCNKKKGLIQWGNLQEQ